ncbi:MAG: hypothetical protein ABEJ42_07870 [Halobacteriaceae archaeon]
MDLAIATAATHALGTLAAVPMPLVDDFLGNYNVAQALLLAFVLGALGTIPLGSRKILALHVTVFGLVFALTPIQLSAVEFRFFGVALLVVGPVLYTSAAR